MEIKISQLGINIKKFRIEKGWSLKKLKDESGVGYATLHDIENGKSKSLNGTNLEKVANALGKATDELLGVEVEIIEYEVGDYKETIKAILKDGNISVDQIPLSDKEKELAFDYAEFFEKMIRKMRGNESLCKE